jgi:hypothetical protein
MDHPHKVTSQEEKTSKLNFNSYEKEWATMMENSFLLLTTEITALRIITTLFCCPSLKASPL